MSPIHPIQFGQALPNPQPVARPTYRPQVQFGGARDRFDDFMGKLRRGRGGGSNGGPGGGNKWTVGRIIRTGFFSLATLLGAGFVVNNFGIETNPNSTRSVLFHKYVSADGGFNADGTCDVRGPGTVIKMFAENYPFDTRPQIVKDVLQPYTKGGVRIDGSGHLDDRGYNMEGIDFRLTYKIPSGEKGDYQNLCGLLSRVVGSTAQLNAEYASRPTTAFETNSDDLMRLIYFNEILPFMMEAANIASVRLQAKDIQEQRDFYEDVITNGLTDQVPDPNAASVREAQLGSLTGELTDLEKERDNEVSPPSEERLAEINPKITELQAAIEDLQAQPLPTKEVQVLKPLKDHLDGLGLEFVSLEFSTFDLPSFLTELNQKRATLSLERSTAEEQMRAYIAQQDTIREEVIKTFAPQIQEQLGKNEADINEAEGRQLAARQTAEKERQAGHLYANDLLAQARGYQKRKIFEAEGQAADQLRVARVYALGKEAEAIAISAPIIASAESEARALLELGEQLKTHPELIERKIIAAVAEVQTALSENRIGTMILSPETSPDHVLKLITAATIGSSEFTPDGTAKDGADLKQQIEQSIRERAAAAQARAEELEAAKTVADEGNGG